MKRMLAAWVSFLLMTSSALGLVAQAGGSGGRTLVVYFSWAENTKEFADKGIDAVTSASTNSRMIAGIIHDKVGGDLIGIRTAMAYTSIYDKVLDVALDEQRRQARPSLSTRIADISKYDVIYLGYPNWWASIPMPVATFLESYDFSGKTIIPFCSHGGGRLGQTVSAIAKSAPKATVLKGLSISYGGGGSLERDIDKWLKSVGATAR